jgi:type II secretion system protein G
MKKYLSITGFTLIELLIVVAIIAILAAIAVPNFLEAQMRSKISRAKSDQRSLATAIEAYCVDYTHYPHNEWPWPNTIDEGKTEEELRGIHSLTTPVAYITSIPLDPFGLPYDWYDTALGRITSGYSYKYGTLGNHPECQNLTYFQWTQWGPSGLGNIYNAQAILLCFGPSFPRSKLSEWAVDYDPTNGTISRGQIVRYFPGGMDHRTNLP